MTEMQEWHERVFRRWAPDYRHRWEIYNEHLVLLLSPEKAWLDIGCGDNGIVETLGSFASVAIGLDVLRHPDLVQAPFIQADARRLPFKDETFDIVTMRMTVEHIEHVPDDLWDIIRVLRPNGTIAIMTTNRWSPFILVPLILPFRTKQWIIQKLFGVNSHDIFPTYHRFNTPTQMRQGLGPLHFSGLHFLEQVPMSNALLTLVFGSWYLVTNNKLLYQFRSTMLAFFTKNNSHTGNK